MLGVNFSHAPAASATPEAVGRDPIPLQRRVIYEVAGRDGHEPLSVVCGDVHQRHWSRIGEGELVREGQAPTRVFLKQYLGRSQEPLRSLWRYDLAGTAVAERVLSGSVRVPRVIGVDEDHLLTVFEFVEVEPLDELLRRDEGEFRGRFDAVMANVAAALAALYKVTPDQVAQCLDGLGPSTKTRDFSSRGTSLGFKGTDIRNIGIAAASDGTAPAAEGASLAVFDFGKPYFAPVEETGAKMLVSVGLLNWGKPLRRFARGPDVELLEIAVRHLLPYINAAAVADEIALQRRFRSTEIKGSRGPMRALRRAGIVTIGRRYLDALERWCAQAVPPS